MTATKNQATKGKIVVGVDLHPDSFATTLVTGPNIAKMQILQLLDEFLYTTGIIRKKERLGGLLKYYYRHAA